MTTHLCRDFLVTGEFNLPYVGMYLSALFLRGVLGYSVVGNTGFHLDSGSFSISSGSGAQINMGGISTHAILIPSASHVVSTSDIERVLVLKSNTNPLFNSGLFRVTGIDTTNNYLYLMPRGLDAPPAESGLTWKLFENEIIATNTSGFRFTGNSLTGDTYRSWGSATATRIILQSPHSDSWQLRITAENEFDSYFTQAGKANGGATCSFAPGFGGNSAGDFAVGGKHLHVPLWWNMSNISNSDIASSVRSQNTLVGFTIVNDDSASASPLTNGVRLYMWGDDATGNCTIICRQHGESTTAQTFISFGIPEDEEVYSPEPIHRLFVYGNTVCNAGNEIRINPGVRNTAPDDQQGNAFGLSMQPISCIASSYCYLAGNLVNSSIMNSSLAEDDVYLGATELYPWDLIAGTYDQREDTATIPPKIILEPRRMGRLPLARRGRENYTTWTTSNDTGQTWLHAEGGLFMPWSGSIMP